VLEQFSAVSEQLSQVQERESHLLERLSAEQAEKHLLQESLAAAHKRIEELEKQKTPPPAFVKANVKKPQAGEKQPRKKRDAKYNRARRREEPTQIVEHRISWCPVCSNRLGGVSVARRRQVIELPPPPAIEVTEHVVYHGWCRKSRDVARSAVGCECPGDRTRTHGRETHQRDGVPAHGDALTCATDPGLSRHPAWAQDQ
jgi:hypothetical protein